MYPNTVCPHDCYRPGDCDGSCTHPEPRCASTPLPWRVVRDTNTVSEPRIRLGGANGAIVADNEPYYPEAITEADAELIAERVNAHDALVSALTSARDRFNRIKRAIYADDMSVLAREGAIEATSALALAKAGAA